MAWGAGYRMYCMYCFRLPAAGLLKGQDTAWYLWDIALLASGEVLALAQGRAPLPWPADGTLNNLRTTRPVPAVAPIHASPQGEPETERLYEKLCQ